MKKTIALCLLLLLSHFFVFSQVNKAPAYPLVTHDPYFSIWSFTDKLNESTTKHWTGKDHSMIGMVRVDGKPYKFMGQLPRKMEKVLPMAEDESYRSTYTKTKPAGNWMSIDYVASADWSVGNGMAASKSVVGSGIAWEEKEIWVRRTFDLSNTNFTELVLLTKWDDNVEVYLNGEKVFTARCCSSGYKETNLSKAIIAKLRKGKNVLAMYCENTGGPGFVDAGLYDRLPALTAQNAIQKNVTITATQTTYEFTCGPVDLTLNFLSPMIASDLELLSRPVTFVTTTFKSKDGKNHSAELVLGISSNAAVNSPKQPVRTESGTTSNLHVQGVGTIEQPVLQKKGDDVRIDWGVLVLASPLKQNPAS